MTRRGCALAITLMTGGCTHAPPPPTTPLFVFFGWMMLGFVLQLGDQWWDLRFLLYPGKCFAEFGRGGTSIPVFFGVMTAVLLAATALGHRRLQRMDL